MGIGFGRSPRVWAAALCCTFLAGPAIALAEAAGAGASPATVASGIDVAAYAIRDSFSDIRLSPTGAYYAATVPLEDETMLAVLKRDPASADVRKAKIVGRFRLAKDYHVSGFIWSAPERLLISMAYKRGKRDQPIESGDIYAMNADGSGLEVLMGSRSLKRPDGKTVMPPDRGERGFAAIIDDLPQDPVNVLISLQPYRSEYTRVEKLDTLTGTRTKISSAPIRDAVFLNDNHGNVRFALGYNRDGKRELYHRDAGQGDWQLLRAEDDKKLMDLPIGFSADDRIAYMRSEHENGPDSITSFDPVSKARAEVLRDPVFDPARIIYRNNSRIPVGAFFLGDGKPRTAFFDANSPEARRYRSLEAAFAGQTVLLNSQTDDERWSLVQVASDRNPGDFFLFDNTRSNAEHVVSRRSWFDPAHMAPSRAIVVAARDGLQLHGLLTVSASAGAKPALVVMPHGGPFGEQDVWGFQDDAQMLAAAGYAVLQINYRGSGGYGTAFERAGQRQWGAKMQDDLTDATRWAIAQGLADPQRVCLYGASYGGYAALMGVAKEPALYKCAVGYVGVYDLNMIQRQTNSRRVIREWMGEPAELEAASVVHMAGRIKAPVFLAAGGKDERAPIAHSRKMEAALRKAGVPVETLYYETEGHGFYAQEHQREFASRLLSFLSRHLGGRTAQAAAATAATAKD
jgi:dipeptidyl aminopeptidase/acylaminoacyl peptidase